MRQKTVNRCGTEGAAERGTHVAFIDADNTLWNTDEVFATGHIALLEKVEKATGLSGPSDGRLELVRRLDQGIALRHPAGLRYPPRLLVQALVHALKGLSTEEALRQSWTDMTSPIDPSRADIDVLRIEREFVASLAFSPPLRPGVRKGLTELVSARWRLLILTEGSRERIVATATYHKIEHLFDRVLEARKHARLFERIRRLIRPRIAIMIGDQLDRDIRPAKAAGYATVYFPGDFRPHWEPTVNDVAPDFTITSFDEVPMIVRQLKVKGGRP